MNCAHSGKTYTGGFSECVGTRGSVELSGGLVLVLGGSTESPPGQAPGPRIPSSPLPVPTRTITTFPKTYLCKLLGK